MKPQQKKFFSYMHLYRGPSMTFLHMQIFQVGLIKRYLLVLNVIRSVLHIDYKMDENGVTWGIVDFCQVIINFDRIKDPLIEMMSIKYHPNNYLDKIFFLSIRCN